MAGSDFDFLYAPGGGALYQDIAAPLPHSPPPLSTHTQSPAISVNPWSSSTEKCSAHEHLVHQPEVRMGQQGAFRTVAPQNGYVYIYVSIYIYDLKRVCVCVCVCILTLVGTEAVDWKAFHRVSYWIKTPLYHD